jgi:hypothetical protein
MPGTQIFTYANLGKETTRGTPVAPTRQMYVEGSGVLAPDFGLNKHERENRGARTRIARATSTREDVAIALKTVDGVSYDDLVVVLSQLKGGLSGVGAGADKTWTCVPSMTAANAPEAYSLDVGDDVQNWRCQYTMFRRITLSSALGEKTQLGLAGFAQRAVKGAKATPAGNSGVKIPGDLWTLKTAATLAGLAGASVQSNVLLDWSLELDTGLLWRHYMDGNLYGSQHVETVIAAKLALTVESTAYAVSEFYDKAVATTLDFVRLKATGPTLGASNYSAQIDLPMLWDVPAPIAGVVENEINVYKISGDLAIDTGLAQSIGAVVVNSLAALP